MISPKKIKNYTKLAMMKSTQVKRELSELESDKINQFETAINSIEHNVSLMSNSINGLIEVNNLIIERVDSNSDLINSLNTKITNMENSMTTIQNTIENLTQRVEALESI